jgi:hypothetical protein
MHYEKLPKGTSNLTTAGILAVGGCLGLGVTVTGFLAVYGIIGLFADYFYGGAGIILTTHEAWYLAALTMMAIVTSVMLAFLAFDMNILSRKALGLSKRVIFPILATAILVDYQASFVPSVDRLSNTWLLLISLTVPLCGILPRLFLNTKPARKVHSR